MVQRKDHMKEQPVVPTTFHEFDFYGDLLTVALVGSRAYVAIKPITDFLGLDWPSQYQRVQRDDVLAEEIKLITVTSADGKQRDMLCLPLEFFHGWLFGVDTHRAKPELREKLTRYRRECFLLLSQAFQSRAMAPVETDVVAQLADTRARVGNLEQDMKFVKVTLSEIRGLSNAHRATAKEMVDQISKVSGVKHQTIWTDLNKNFHVASYANIPDEKWPDVQQCLQQRLDSARKGKGIEEQPTLFDQEKQS